MRQRLFAQCLALDEFDPCPAVHAVEQSQPGVDLDDVFLGQIVADAMMDQRTEIRLVPVGDLDHGGSEIEQRGVAGVGLGSLDLGFLLRRSGLLGLGCLCVLKCKIKKDK